MWWSVRSIDLILWKISEIIFDPFISPYEAQAPESKPDHSQHRSGIIRSD